MGFYIPPIDLDQDVYTLAKERMRKAYKLVDHVGVSFSAGKDSMATLEVAIEVAEELDRLPVHVIFFDEEIILPDTHDYADRTRKRKEVEMDWYCLPFEFSNICSFKEPRWISWDPKYEEVWFRKLPKWAITREDLTTKLRNYHNYEMNGIAFPPERFGTVGCALGTRAEESMRRRQNVSRKEHDNYITLDTEKYSQGNVYKIFPVYDWRVEDIWTAVKLFGWDYNHAYDKMGKKGINPREQRIAPLFGDGLAGVENLRELYPHLWGELTQRIPGSASAMLYAKSKLYAYKGVIEKPEGYSWMEWVKEYISRYPVEVRNELIDDVKQRLRLHYKKCGEPIPEDGSKHPITEESWPQIMKLIMRQNNLGRRQVDYRLPMETVDYRKKIKRMKLLEMAKNEDKKRYGGE